jgi:hypothetical protein
MPIPPFIAGEVLSAMRLNAMVQIVNDSEALRRSFSQPFRQIDFYGNNNSDTVAWTWMFRYVPRLRYYKLRYQWVGWNSGDSIAASINGVEAFNVTTGPSGTFNQTIDLARTTSPFNLQEGKIYTLYVYVTLNWTGDPNDYVRMIWAFMTNNSGYTPPIFVG